MNNPNICVSLGSINYQKVLEYLEKYDFAEIRIDLLKLDDQELAELFSIHKNLIASCRYGKHDEEQRCNILMNALRFGAAWVDVEIETKPKWRQPIIDLAHELKRKVIVSYHNFDCTPQVDELNQIVESLFAAGADIAKISCLVNSPEDNARILGLYAQYEKLVAIGMGSGGILTRVISPLMGAPFTYASLEGVETAPGQLEEKQLRAIINLLDSFTSGK